MTATMASVQPDQIVVDQEDSPEMEQQNDGMEKPQSGGPTSPDGVDQLQPNSSTEDDDDEGESEDEESDEEEEEEEGGEEANLDELDGAALLALTKSRLEKQPTPAPQPAPENDVGSDSEDEEDATGDNYETEHATNAANNEGSAEQAASAKPPATESPIEEKKSETEHGAPTTQDDEPVKDQAYYLELAMKKSKEAEMKAKNDTDTDLELAIRKTKEAEIKAKNDTDPAYLLKLAEQKVAEANAKARADEEATPGEVIKPALEAKPTRSENSELWALLNYSKMRLETGSTPNVGGGTKKSGSKQGSVRGDDNMSVSSKLSKASKRSLGSRRSIKSGAPISVLGGPGDLRNSQHGSAEGGENKTDAPFPDVTNDGDDSVDGSVSLESNTKDREEESSEDEENSDDSDEEESSEEEEEDLPDFLKDAEEIDPEEAKAMYEAAKFKAASILSVSEEKLTDVQMLQAIAIAEEAARKGDDKFSTKRSLFKLNEAKVEDLKAFLSFGSPKTEEGGAAAAAGEEEPAGFRQRWRNRWSSFKQRCDEIDSKKQQERGGPTSLQDMPSKMKDMSNAAMLDLKAQIDELEQNIKKAKS